VLARDICTELDVPAPTLSDHLDDLKNEDLANVRRESTYQGFNANPQQHGIVGGMRGGSTAGFRISGQACKIRICRIEIEPTRVYDIYEARAFLSGKGIEVDAIAPQVEGKFMSTFIRATGPDRCCAPRCCL
jgi:Bacterial regulatory protein, arsR family